MPIDSTLTIKHRNSAPLNVIPSWIVQILQVGICHNIPSSRLHNIFYVIQTGVALNRIATFLSEEEVSDQVSSLKRAGSIDRSIAVGDQELGIQHASFKWNEVDEDKDQDNGSLTSKLHARANGSSGTEIEPATSDNISVDNSASEVHRFELRDINIVFPTERLTLITGPSG